MANLINYINENSNILSVKQDKNPMFYVFTAIKLKANKAADLKNDFQLKEILKKVEIFSNKIGNDAVKSICNSVKPISIMMDIEDCKNAKAYQSKAEELFALFKRIILTDEISFSASMKIEDAFNEFLNEQAFKDFFGNLEVRK